MLIKEEMYFQKILFFELLVCAFYKTVLNYRLYFLFLGALNSCLHLLIKKKVQSLIYSKYLWHEVSFQLNKIQL